MKSCKGCGLVVLWFQNYMTCAWEQEAKLEIVEASIGSSLVVSHHNVNLYDKYA
jgi:hypothetical protein